VDSTKTEIRLHYAFDSNSQKGAAIDNPLFELLAGIAETGSIRHAAQALGLSYRHVWGALKNWERVLGERLLTWSQGQRARLTPFAQKLLWAERRARTRLQPHIEALRSDLSRVVIDALDERCQVLSVRASHDLALPVLKQHLADEAHLHLDIGFQGSVDALRALNDRHCVIAGFHVPVVCNAAPIFSRALKPLLKPRLHKLIACAVRVQGLMLRKEHNGHIHSLSDLARARLRFVNRQTGSGTRMLIDHLIESESIDQTALSGYAEHIEHTHVAVALCVASGVVDAGVGIEAAALQYGLHFVPLVREHYFLACRAADLEQPGIKRLRDSLAGPQWRAILSNLPGYEVPTSPGEVLVIERVLPWWRSVLRGRRESPPSAA
jgi:putative molybdopterin biosynthesis protein